MKNLPYIIGIPVLAVALVVGGAMIWKMNTTQVDTTAMAHPAPRPNPLNQRGGGKPANAFNTFFVTPTPLAKPDPALQDTPTPASAAAMNADVNAVGDDGGASDFSSLQSQVNGL